MPIQIQMDTTLKQDSGPQKKISAELFLYIHTSQINNIFRKSIIQLLIITLTVQEQIPKKIKTFSQ